MAVWQASETGHGRQSFFLSGVQANLHVRSNFTCPSTATVTPVSHLGLVREKMLVPNPDLVSVFFFFFYNLVLMTIELWLSFSLCKMG